MQVRITSVFLLHARFHSYVAEERRGGTSGPSNKEDELLRALGCIRCCNKHGKGHNSAEGY